MLIVLGSASGSPGVTTAVLALAFTWSRPVVVVDADPVGGSAILAGYFRGEMPNPESLVRLWAGLRQGRLAEVLPEALFRVVADHEIDLIPGPAGPAQARSVHGVWAGLAPQLRTADSRQQDVLVDVGRFGAEDSADALVSAADLVCVVTKSDLVSVSAAAARLSDFDPDIPVAVIVVGEGRPYSASVIGKTLNAPVVGTLPHHPEGAQTYSAGTKRTRRTAELDRAAKSLGEAIRTHITRERNRLVVSHE